MTTTKSFILPDLFAMCPFTMCDVNPHYERVRAESTAWVASFGVHGSKKQAAMESHNYELLAAFSFPSANYEDLRLCCDFISLLFVYDEFSDMQDGDGAKISGKVFLKALDGEPVDESPLSKITYEYVYAYIPTRLSLISFEALEPDFLL